MARMTDEFHAMPHYECVSFPFIDDAFPVSVMTHDIGQYSYPLHTHLFTELVVILAGHGTHILGDSATQIAAGDVFVVTNGNVHAYDEVEEICLVNILFRPEVLAPLESSLRVLPGYYALFLLEPRFRCQHSGRSRLHISPESMTTVIELIERMEAEEQTQLPGYQTIILTTLVQLIVSLARHYTATMDTPSQLVIQIGTVISYLERHFAEPLTLEQLADIASMSVRNLDRRFHEGTGLSPIEYLIHLRIRKSADFLRATDLPITDIAAAVGIPDSNYFSRQFRQVMGQSPRAYRLSQRDVTGECEEV